jgi:hypothetical protein
MSVNWRVPHYDGISGLFFFERVAKYLPQSTTDPVKHACACSRLGFTWCRRWLLAEKDKGIAKQPDVFQMLKMTACVRSCWLAEAKMVVGSPLSICD